MKPDVKVLLLGLAALAIFLIYSLSPLQLGEEDTEIRKADFIALATPVLSPDSTQTAKTDTV
ncbi:MAG: hypothetical protein K2H18_06230, partial [Muribaculaceae bacterium]|nr:hypothetical protein [Muribaculaceae bacterium]